GGGSPATAPRQAAIRAAQRRHIVATGSAGGCATRSLSDDSPRRGGRGNLEAHVSSSSSATTDVGDTLWHDDGEDAHGTDAGRSGLLRPSVTLGRYVVLYRLGTGGMGVVYAAYDPELDRKVALKLLRKGSSDPQKRRHAQERLLEEARAMARLTHPN